MQPAQVGLIRVFRLFGMPIYVHWLCLVILILHYLRVQIYDNPIWHVAVFAVFMLIIVLHELGHALACRSVGGVADRIIIWPLGGMALIRPPARPGPTLWSVFAGPLVNILLTPVLVGVFLLAGGEWQWLVVDGRITPPAGSDFLVFAWEMMWINAALLVFNLLPIYPMDGGLCLFAALWFLIGPTASQRVVAGIGLALSAGLAVWAGVNGVWVVAVLAAYFAYRALLGLNMARSMVDLPQGGSQDSTTDKGSQLHG